MRAPGWIRTRDSSKQSTTDPHLDLAVYQTAEAKERAHLPAASYTGKYLRHSFKFIS